jgi:tetratricopeptide (TPR) repeat protein
MLYSRLLAGISFLSFALALGGTLQLAVAGRAWPMEIGNTRPLEDLAERQPALARSALRTAVRLNPRDSPAWMALGVMAERDDDMDQAADCFLKAEEVDRQHLPAWTAANFFFRRADDLQFWQAAARAAALSYDDPAPLIELADHREPNAIAALQRLGDTASLERGYLYFLIDQSRWWEAEEAAARLESWRNPGDLELLLNFTSRLIEADEGKAALVAWNGSQPSPAPDRATRGTLVNRDFQRQPSGQGFDWRVTKPPRGSVHWEPSKLEFRLTGATPDACALLEQWVLLDPGRYRLRFEYRTEGLAEETGLHWILRRGSHLETSSGISGNLTEWNFRVTKAGLYDLAWVYNRVPGTAHQEGRAELAFADLAIL